MPATISPVELAERFRSNPQLELLDVRTPAEYAQLHVPFARNLPLDRLDPQSLNARNGKDPGQPLYVICQKGGRGGQACQQLEKAGYHVVNVEGGTQAWADANLPVMRSGSRVISLDRQVRIAAGSLVVAGVMLGAFVHPYWLGLAGFVGAGLVFAGVTDTCGMAMLLGRMPWNQVGSSRAAQANGTTCARS